MWKNVKIGRSGDARSKNAHNSSKYVEIGGKMV